MFVGAHSVFLPLIIPPPFVLLCRELLKDNEHRMGLLFDCVVCVCLGVSCALAEDEVKDEQRRNRTQEWAEKQGKGKLCWIIMPSRKTQQQKQEQQIRHNQQDRRRRQRCPRSSKPKSFLFALLRSSATVSDGLPAPQQCAFSSASPLSELPPSQGETAASRSARENGPLQHLCPAATGQCVCG